MTAPITSQLERLFHAHAVNPAQHQGLVADLMRLVYDEKEKAVDEVLGTDFEAAIVKFAEKIDRNSEAIRDDLDALWHARCLDNQREEEDTNA